MEFSPARGQHRLIFSSTHFGSEVQIDLIPFGGVASPDGSIAWPPDGDVVMNVSGFEAALRSAIAVGIDEGLTLRVASIAGLTFLKLSAWLDRGRTSNKDAADLYRLIASYADAGNLDRLYDFEMPLLESAGFDMRVAGADLLGRDVGAIAEGESIERIQAGLSKAGNRERLVADMTRTSPYEDGAVVEALFKAFCVGLGTAREIG